MKSLFRARRAEPRRPRLRRRLEVQPLEDRRLLAVLDFFTADGAISTEGGTRVVTILSDPGGPATRALNFTARFDSTTNEVFAGYVLQFSQSDIASGELVIRNWATLGANWFPADGTLNTSLSDTSVDGVSLGGERPTGAETYPYAFGTFVVDVPSQAPGEYVMTVDTEGLGLPIFTVFVNANADPQTITDYGDVIIRVIDTPEVFLADTDVTVNEGETATFTVSLSNAALETTTVTFQTADGTAIAGSDYQSQSGTLVFDIGESQKVIEVVTSQDSLHEADETFLVQLTGAVAANVRDTADESTGTIVDDDPAPDLTISDATVTEGTGGTQSATLTLSLSEVAGREVTVEYTTADGSAVAPDDYTAPAQPATATIAAGQQTATLVVPIVTDDVDEDDEDFTVTLSNAVGANLSDDVGVVNIVDDDDAPVVNVSAVTVTEGVDATATFTVGLSNPSSRTITVEFATQPDTAADPDDYTGNSGTLTFDPGETSKTVEVEILDDLLNEADETFTLLLSNPNNATVGTPSTDGVIIDDDANPAVNLAPSDQQVAEGNSGDLTTVTLTATLAAASGQTVTVVYQTQDGTATSGDSDYTADSNTLTFQPGETSVTFTVVVVGDDKFEPDETFTVALSNPSNALLGSNSTADVDIVNDDAMPEVSLVGDESTLEGDTPTSTTLTFTATLSGESSETITVPVSTTDGTATTADNDYLPDTQTLTFDPGQTSQTYLVTVVGDDVLESDETFTVALGTPTGATLASGGQTATGTIQNDDGVPVISIADVSQFEGNTGQTPTFTFTLTLNNPSDQPITVEFATDDGTGTTGDNDYQAASGTVTFDPLATSATIEVVVVGDDDFEPDETFFVNLFNESGAVLASSQATGTIRNDDLSVGLAGDVSLSEGDGGQQVMTFTVTLVGNNSAPVSVEFNTQDGTAASGDSDYTPASGTLTFQPGQTSHTIQVTIQGDTKFETDETFTVNLSNPVGTNVDPSSATGTILNDDSQPTVSISDVTLAEGDGGTTPFTFTVSLSNPSSQTVQVVLDTVDGAATVGDGDYQAISSLTLDVLPGTTSQTVVVNVNGDTTIEPDEDFILRIASATNASGVSKPDGTGLIVNDDGLARLSGYVYVDSNNNGQRDTGEAGIAGVTIGLLQNNAVVDARLTDSDGFYEFTGLAAGTDYQLLEVHPAAYFDGSEQVGSLGGSIDPVNRNDEIFNITIPSGTAVGTDYNFGELGLSDPLEIRKRLFGSNGSRSRGSRGSRGGSSLTSTQSLPTALTAQLAALLNGTTPPDNNTNNQVPQDPVEPDPPPPVTNNNGTSSDSNTRQRRRRTRGSRTSFRLGGDLEAAWDLALLGVVQEDFLPPAELPQDEAPPETAPPEGESGKEASPTRSRQRTSDRQESGQTDSAPREDGEDTTAEAENVA